MSWKKYKVILIYLFLSICSLSVHAQKDWKLHSKENNTELWIKNVPNSELKQFKIQTTIKKDILSLYRMMKDVQNMHLWYDKVKSVNLLKKINEAEAIYLLEYDLPFPFEDRISTIKGSIMMDAKNTSFKVHTDYHPYEVPKDKKDLLLITELSSSWEVSIGKNNELIVMHTGYMNPSGNIPKWLINDGVTSGPKKTIKNMIKYIDKY